VDGAADVLIRRILRRRFPSHDFLTEESPPTNNRSDFKWIIDPLDGTTNYAHHYPQVGVSIGLEHGGRIVLGGVYDPFRMNFSGPKKERGVLRQGKRQRRLSISATPRLSGALLLTGFPYDRRERADLYLSYLKAFMMRIQGFAAPGGCVGFLLVACGRVDVIGSGV